jgi:transposase-like protein
MKRLPRRQYTQEFRRDAVKQLVEGRRAKAAVARELEISAGTL